MPPRQYRFSGAAGVGTAIEGRLGVMEPSLSGELSMIQNADASRNNSDVPPCVRTALSIESPSGCCRNAPCDYSLIEYSMLHNFRNSLT